MSKPIFDNSDDEDNRITFKSNNDYAKTYNTWRKKEELLRMKTKFDLDDESDDEPSSCTDDDEEVLKMDEKTDLNFFKTLSSLKNKDPKIYDQNERFFGDEVIEAPSKMKTKDVKISEESSSMQKFQNARNNISSTFSLTKTIPKTAEEETLAVNYEKFFQGQSNTDDNELNESEKFLMDYISNKRYMDTKKDNHDSDNDFVEDDEQIRKQEEFEHKYNFRFEEPDNDFIKRYPRTVDNSVRCTDDRRKIKRNEIKERKLLEKQKKMEELEHAKKMKRLEYEEKLKALKEITGNEDVPFNDDDLDGDFDPSAHDKRMQMVFNNDYYSVEDQEKPVFSDMDDELEIDQPFEHIDYVSGEMNENYDDEAVVDEDAPHCEDINMDCEYQEKTAEDEIKENMKKRKWRRKKSQVTKALMKEKPTFDPDDQKYEEYFNEYYKLDCEDFIGDMPCRFKYREVVPNTFGLTIDEILKADDKELNKWCTIKRTVGYLPEQQEKNDHFTFMRRAQNEALKMKILPSLYKEETEEHQVTKKKRNRGKKATDQVVEELPEVEESPKKKKKKKSKNATVTSESAEIEQVTESTINDNEKNVADLATKSKKDVKQPEENTTVSKKKKQNVEETQAEEKTGKANKKRKISETETTDAPKSKKKKSKNVENASSVPVSADTKKVDSKKKKEKEKWKQFSNKIKKPNNKEAEIDISDERLKAYGFNPKKFKNKVKYGHGIF